MDLEARLRAHPSFTTLSADDVQALAGAMLVRSFPGGHVLVREGDRADDVHFVVEGRVSVTRTRGGATHALNAMGAGDLFGLVAIVDDAPRSATCTTDGACTVASIPRSALSLLMNQQAGIAYAFQHALVTQLARDFRNLDARIRAKLVGG